MKFGSNFNFLTHRWQSVDLDWAFEKWGKWSLGAVFAPWTWAAAGSPSQQIWWSAFLWADWAVCIAVCLRASCWSSVTTTTVTEMSFSSTVTLRPSASSCCMCSTENCASCPTCVSSPSTMRCCTGAWKVVTFSPAARNASMTASPTASSTSFQRRSHGAPRSLRAAGWRGWGGRLRSPRLRWQHRSSPLCPCCSWSSQWWCCVPALCQTGKMQKPWTSTGKSPDKDWTHIQTGLHKYTHSKTNLHAQRSSEIRLPTHNCHDHNLHYVLAYLKKTHRKKASVRLIFNFIVHLFLASSPNSSLRRWRETLWT